MFSRAASSSEMVLLAPSAGPLAVNNKVIDNLEDVLFAAAAALREAGDGFDLNKLEAMINEAERLQADAPADAIGAATHARAAMRTVAETHIERVVARGGSPTPDAADELAALRAKLSDGQLLNEVELQRLEALLGQLDGSATAAKEPEPEPEPSWAGPPALVSVAIHAQAGDETACVVRISTSPLRPSSPVAEPVEAVAADLDAKALVQINANGGSGEEACVVRITAVSPTPSSIEETTEDAAEKSSAVDVSDVGYITKAPVEETKEDVVKSLVEAASAPAAASVQLDPAVGIPGVESLIRTAALEVEVEAKEEVVAGAESPEVVEVRKPRPSSEQMDAQLKAQVQEDGTVKMSLTGATVYDVGPAGELLGKREIESPPPLRKTPSPPQDDEEVITVSPTAKATGKAVSPALFEEAAAIAEEAAKAIADDTTALVVSHRGVVSHEELMDGAGTKNKAPWWNQVQEGCCGRARKQTPNKRAIATQGESSPFQTNGVVMRLLDFYTLALARGYAHAPATDYPR